MKNRSVVVLGGSGFVGRHIVNRLAADERPVLVPTQSREYAKHLILLPTVDVVEADVHDRDALIRLFEGAGAVINLIGVLNQARSGDFHRVHVELAQNVVAACKAAGVSRLLHMSALNADPSGPSEYLRTKGEAEQIVVASALQWTIFQPSVIFGPEDSFLNLFARLQRFLPVIPLGCPKARFQPVYVGDVAQAFVQALEDEVTIGHRYALCGPTVYTLKDLVRYVGLQTGYERPVLGLPAALAKLQAWMLERLPGKLMSRDNVASMSVDSVCSTHALAPPGFQPTSLETIAPTYLSPEAVHSKYDDYRVHSGRQG